MRTVILMTREDPGDDFLLKPVPVDKLVKKRHHIPQTGDTIAASLKAFGTPHRQVVVGPVHDGAAKGGPSVYSNSHLLRPRSPCLIPDDSGLALPKQLCFDGPPEAGLWGMLEG